MVVEGITYTSVIKNSEARGDPNSSNYRKAVYYWAKGVGVIKRELKIGVGETKTELLVRHN